MASKDKLVVPKFTSFTSKWHNAPYDAISLSRKELSMAGKAVVVTGGGTRIGKAIATAFAQAGASSVAIFGRREKVLEDAVVEIVGMVGDGNCYLMYEVVDLTKQEQVEQAMASVAKKAGGKIDIVVCNAGDLVRVGPALEADVDTWMQAFDYNVRIPLNTVKAFMPYAAQEGAAVIHISSGIAHMSPVPGLSAHGASKAAGVKMMEFLRVENPTLRIVHTQPGSVETDMSRKAGAPPGKDDPALAGQFHVWLASTEAAFLNGNFVWANWDVDELKVRKGEIVSSRLLQVGLDGVPM